MFPIEFFSSLLSSETNLNYDFVGSSFVFNSLHFGRQAQHLLPCTNKKKLNGIVKTFRNNRNTMLFIGSGEE